MISISAPPKTFIKIQSLLYVDFPPFAWGKHYKTIQTVLNNLSYIPTKRLREIWMKIMAEQRTYTIFIKLRLHYMRSNRKQLKSYILKQCDNYDKNIDYGNNDDCLDELLKASGFIWAAVRRLIHHTWWGSW